MTSARRPMPVAEISLVLATLAVAMLTGCRQTAAPAPSYPATKKGDVVDDYAGTKVADPYRWMESLDSKDVSDWVAASNAVTEPYLNSLPLRGHFKTRLTELWNYPRSGVPVVEGGHIFYARNTGLQKQAPVFMRAAVDAPPAMIIDPNVISSDGSLSLSEWQPSPNG